VCGLCVFVCERNCVCACRCLYLATEDESVHRIMQVLMALDLPGKQGTRCVCVCVVCACLFVREIVCV